MAKSPSIKINLGVAQRVDVGPLREALALFQRSVDELRRAHERRVELQAEVDNFLSATDPDDTERLQVISIKQVQLSCLPGFIARAERQLEEAVIPRLVHGIADLQDGCKAAFRTLREAVVGEVAEFIRPYFAARPDPLSGALRDRARELAEQADAVLAIDARLARVAQLNPPSQPRNDPESYDRNLLQIGRALISLAEDKEPVE